MPLSPTLLSRTAQRDSLLDQPRANPAASEDWDALFDAVTTRLREIAGVVATLPGLAGMPPVARGRVLECAEALEQLHRSLLQQQASRSTLLLQPARVHGDPEPLRTEPAGPVDGDKRHRHPRAQHDALTSLPNRSHFRDLLRHALAKTDLQRPSLALLYMDLDGFKPINDQHGHDVGDRMLHIVATRLTRAIRAGDSVGRMGGDEFACLLGDIDDREQLSHLACKLFDAVSAPLQVGKLQLTVRPSIGIAICPIDGGTADTLLKRADAARYRAKRAQSGYAFFDRRADMSASSVGQS